MTVVIFQALNPTKVFPKFPLALAISIWPQAMRLVNLPQNRCTDLIPDSASASAACWRRDMVSVLRNESEAAKA